MKDFFSIDIIIFSTLVASILALIFSLYIFILNSKIKHKQNKAEIIGQRERLEKQIYELNKIMLADPNRLFDNTKLLLQFPDKSLTIDKTVPNYSFFSILGIDIGNIQVEDRTALCLMPFNKKFNKTYQAIRVACENSDYKCSRSDMFFNPGKILQQIVNMILKSQIIIAVLDGKNPNVFYEIGIAHAVGKAVILIANFSSANDVPFDLKSDRLVLYSDDNELVKSLSATLKNIQYAD